MSAPRRYRSGRRHWLSPSAEMIVPRRARGVVELFAGVFGRVFEVVFRFLVLGVDQGFELGVAARDTRDALPGRPLGLSPRS